MTNEEKARAYDEALTTAKRIISKNCSEVEKLCLECIFPQLKESEDEKIRKTLVEYFGPSAQLDFIRGVPIQKIRDWLEKQKDLDKMIVVSPKVWDKAISDAFENGKRDSEKQKEPHYTKRNALFDKCVENCDPEIMQRVSNEVDKMLKKEQKSEGWSEEFEKNIHELLYNKLRWDSEDGRISTAVFIDDKTLKDIVTGIWFYVGKEAMKNPNMELPKQEWSNEDEEKLKAICTYLRDYPRLAKINDVKRFNAYCDWLKSLRPSWKSCEGQKEAL